MGSSSSTPARRETRTYTGPQAVPGRNVQRVDMIPDEFATVDQVTQALRRNGLESCNLIVGVDFTKSNEWSGKRTFGGRSLHTIDDPTVTNPYEDVIESIGQSLRDFDEDNSIPVFGFGDDVTADNSVFTFMKEDTNQQGIPFESIRQRYREIVPNVVMAGPTSFAPIINQAVNIVNQTGQYHILVIIADGQVTRSVDIPPHAVSKNEKETIDAITYASNFPLSIVMVGVGDGPWESMIYFDDYLVNRKFDNFQFVEFHKIASQANSRSQKLAQFALQALMEIPEQYKIIKHMGYLNKGPYQFAANVPEVVAFPMPKPVFTPAYHMQPRASSSASGGGGCSTNYSLGPSQPPLARALPHDGSIRVSSQPPPAYNQAVNANYTVATAPIATAPSAPLATMTNCPPIAPVHNVQPPRPSMPARQPSTAEMELSMLQESLLCCICEDRQKDTVFQCGHETCGPCASLLNQCPTCRQDIQVRIKRYGV